MEISSKKLKRMHDRKASSVFYHLELSTSYPTSLSNFSSLPLSVTALIERYAHLFQNPQGLPPILKHSHHISLIPNSSPVNVRPFKIPPFSKN